MSSLKVQKKTPSFARSSLFASEPPAPLYPPPKLYLRQKHYQFFLDQRLNQVHDHIQIQYHYQEVGIFGYWKKEDCKKISEASGRLLYSAGVMLEESRKHREAGHPLKAEQSASAAKYATDHAPHTVFKFSAYSK